MIRLEFLYHEIIERDYTAIDVYITRKEKTVAHYRNYVLEDLDDEICANQSEYFTLPSLAAAKQFIKSADTYSLVPISDQD